MPTREIKLNLKHKINTNYLRKLVKFRRDKLIAMSGGDCNSFFANCCNCCGGNPATCDCNQIICRDYVDVSFPGGFTNQSGGICDNEWICDCSTIGTWDHRFEPNIGECGTGGSYSEPFSAVFNGGSGCVNVGGAVYFCATSNTVEITATYGYEQGNGSGTVWKKSVSIDEFGCGANEFTLPIFSNDDCCQATGDVTISIPATNPDYCAGCACDCARFPDDLNFSISIDGVVWVGGGTLSLSGTASRSENNCIYFSYPVNYENTGYWCWTSTPDETGYWLVNIECANNQSGTTSNIPSYLTVWRVSNDNVLQYPFYSGCMQGCSLLTTGTTTGAMDYENYGSNCSFIYGLNGTYTISLP